MSPDSFDQLSHNQGIAMLISMHVRNELEDFHVKYLQDNVMPELNSIIRYPIYDFFENVLTSEKTLGWLAMMVPDYWEVPGKDPKPEFSGEYLWQGKPFPKSAEKPT